MDARPRDSCRELFKVLKTLPLTSQNIFPLALFVAKNKILFKENSEVHNIKARNNSTLFSTIISFNDLSERTLLFWHQGV
jgi:hypothetical protein